MAQEDVADHGIRLDRPDEDVFEMDLESTSLFSVLRSPLLAARETTE